MIRTGAYCRDFVLLLLLIVIEVMQQVALVNLVVLIEFRALLVQ